MNGQGRNVVAAHAVAKESLINGHLNKSNLAVEKELKRKTESRVIVVLHLGVWHVDFTAYAGRSLAE